MSKGRRLRSPSPLAFEAVVAGGELGGVQIGVEPARGQKLVVGTLLRDVAVAHH